MPTPVSEVRRIESAEGIPLGTYTGTWSGAVVRFETDMGKYEGTASIAMRGTVPCKVEVGPTILVYADNAGEQ